MALYSGINRTFIHEIGHINISILAPGLVVGHQYLRRKRFSGNGIYTFLSERVRDLGISDVLVVRERGFTCMRGTSG